MSVEAKAAFDAAKGGIDAADKALDLYNRVLDKVIPWKSFDSTIRELTKYEEDYSSEAGKLVGEVKTLILNSKDEYFEATQSVYEWCGVASRLLQAYLDLFSQPNEKKAEAQKKILMKVLNDGLTKMTESQEKLAKSSKSFNSASGKLSELNTQLKNDFDEDSTYYNKQVNKLRAEAYGGAAAGVIGGVFGLIISYSVASGVVEGKLIPELKKKFKEVKKSFEDLQKVVDKADDDIDKAKSSLKKEIHVIGEMKITTEETVFYVEYDDLMLSQLKDSASKLIKQCQEYIKRHGGDEKVVLKLVEDCEPA